MVVASGAGKHFPTKNTSGKRETIYYQVILEIITCWFTVNGKIAYCLESHRSSAPSGDYVAQVLDSNKNLQKVLYYYGYGGGQRVGSYLSGKSEEEICIYPQSHYAAYIQVRQDLQDVSSRRSGKRRRDRLY